MKKIIFTLLLLICFSAYGIAQNKGETWLGASVGFTYQGVSGTTTSGFQFLPEVVYGVADRVGIGAAVGFMTQDQSLFKVNGIGLAPFVRLNAVKKEKFNLFFDGAFNYTRTNLKSKVSDESVSGNTIGFSLNPGISYKVADNIALSVRTSLLSYTKNTDSNIDVDAFLVDLNFQSTSLGIHFIF